MDPIYLPFSVVTLIRPWLTTCVVTKAIMSVAIRRTSRLREQDVTRKNDPTAAQCSLGAHGKSA